MSECVLWTGYINPNGYPRLSTYTPEGERYAHRAACPDLGPGQQAHHKCRMKACVNPVHLVAVSPTEHRRIHSEDRRV